MKQVTEYCDRCGLTASTSEIQVGTTLYDVCPKCEKELRTFKHHGRPVQVPYTMIYPSGVRSLTYPVADGNVLISNTCEAPSFTASAK